jgi:dolichyl-phosphate beta-glucosyltransferase
MTSGPPPVLRDVSAPDGARDEGPGSGAPSLTLVVPLYNEEERVAQSAPELLRFMGRFPVGSELIFVDDGSTDATVAAVEAAVATTDDDVAVRVLRRPHRGKGAAVGAGLGAAQAEYAGFCDVDLSTSLDQLEEVLRAARMGPVLAIGSRDVVGSTLVKRQSALRETLGRAYNRAVQLLLVPGISDTQCGTKVARTDLWRAILPHCTEEGFAWDVEAIAVARRLGIVVQEVAVRWHHDDRSRVRVGRDGLKMVAALGRIKRTVKDLSLAAADGAVPAPSVFDEAQASTLLESDSAHWWFRSKAAFVATALRRHGGRQSHRRLVDVGAGAGGVTAMLGLPPSHLVSLDGSEVLCREARQRHALLSAVAMGEAIPLRDGSAGVVSLLDVIEHLDHPHDTLAEAWRVLDPSGLLVVNVPAHQWLWSSADVYLGHRRRYTRRLLRQHLEASGFRVVWMSHVFSWLVLPVWMTRKSKADGGPQLGLDRAGALVDSAALVLTTLERLLIRWCTLPLGTSILCVAAKDGATDEGPATERAFSAPTT